MAAIKRPNFKLYRHWRELTPIQRHICLTTLGVIDAPIARPTFWARLFK